MSGQGVSQGSPELPPVEGPDPIKFTTRLVKAEDRDAIITAL